MRNMWEPDSGLGRCCVDAGDRHYSGKMVAMVIRNQPDHSAARSPATKLELPLSTPTHHHHRVQAG